jgi:class 3 adenylate cyclase
MATRPTRKRLPSGVITAMFTDIRGSTKLKGLMEGDTSARRDARFRETIKGPHDKVVLGCVREAGGHQVNATGDGFCFAFTDVEEAVLCALRIQDGLETVQTPFGPLRVRIGLHTGIAGAAEGDYAAATLDKAARVQSQADGGQVLLSRETHALVVGKVQGVTFRSAGTVDLKGLGAEELFLALRSGAGREAPAPSPARPPQPAAPEAHPAPPAEAADVPAGPDLFRLENPYNFSGTATRQTFKGRQAELDELLDSVESGTHTAIFGLQRMGKTSLIEEGLRERLDAQPALARRTLLAQVDLMKLGGDEVTYKDLFSAIIRAITDQLAALGLARDVERLHGLTNELWAGNRYDRGDRTQFFATVSKVLRGIADMARRRVVLFVDEFSEVRRVIERNKRVLGGNPLRTKNVLPHEMYIDVPFMHHLSHLLKDAELQKRLTVVVAVRPFMAEYDAREGLQILKLMKPITLYYLDEAAAKALITEPLEGRVSYGPEAVHYLYRLTAGHPYILQFILKHVIDKLKREKRAAITLEDVKAMETRMITEGPAYDAQFEVILSDYSVAEVLHPQEALLGKGALALVAKIGQEQPHGWVGEPQIFEALGKHNISKEKAASLLSQLVRTKILEEDSSSGGMCYRMSVPLLRKRFVKQNLYLKYFRS